MTKEQAAELILTWQKFYNSEVSCSKEETKDNNKDLANVFETLGLTMPNEENEEMGLTREEYDRKYPIKIYPR